MGLKLKLLRQLIRTLPRGRMPLINLIKNFLPSESFVDYWNGYKMIFNLADRDSYLLYFNDITERYQTPYFLAFLNEGMVVADIGANNGYYSLLASSNLNRVSIFAFEANPALVTQLNTVITINNLQDKIEVVEGAVNDQPGTLHFDFSNLNHQGTGHAVNNPKEKSKLSLVNSVVFDDWFENSKFELIDVVKIDVEGAEMNVLRGMKRSLESQAISVLFIEVHKNVLPDFNTNADELYEFLDNHGYQVRILPSEFVQVKGNRYKPKIKDIPLNIRRNCSDENEDWLHCIAFSDKAFKKYSTVLKFS